MNASATRVSAGGDRGRERAGRETFDSVCTQLGLPPLLLQLFVKSEIPHDQRGTWGALYSRAYAAWERGNREALELCVEQLRLLILTHWKLESAMPLARRAQQLPMAGSKGRWEDQQDERAARLAFLRSRPGKSTRQVAREYVRAEIQAKREQSGQPALSPAELEAELVKHEDRINTVRCFYQQRKNRG